MVVGMVEAWMGKGRLLLTLELLGSRWRRWRSPRRKRRRRWRRRRRVLDNVVRRGWARSTHSHSLSHNLTHTGGDYVYI